MPPSSKPPNPYLFGLLLAISFSTFYLVNKHRERTSPASAGPRQLDHPLVPPRHKEEHA
ncbi:hypothetical protein BDV98DRAFT_499788 [Pterulicium gracile]|uniref:Uncharacterized protein n=1 Tax=Pterulicium gracile TaxID=1884261 RepID=A0A5C3QV24_9AGAR|nr:hypothetical protein BDV98DRAFT_499788 [Pterula gracilis]